MKYSRLISRHFEITSKEIQGYLLTTLLMSVGVFFFVWRTTDFSIQTGIGHFVMMFILGLFSLACFIGISKIVAIIKNYTATYSMWLNGLLVGFVVGFISYGYLPIFFPGVVEVKTIERLRHGIVFPGENKKEIFLILAVAPILSLFLALIFHSLYHSTGAAFFKYGLIINGLIAFFSLLPFRKSSGLHLFYTNRAKYFILLYFVIFFLIFLFANSVWAAIVALTGLILLYWIYRKFLKKYF